MSVKYGKSFYVVSVLKTENTPVMVMVKTGDQRTIIKGPKERRIINKALVDGLCVGFAVPEGFDDPYSSVRYAVV